MDGEHVKGWLTAVPDEEGVLPAWLNAGRALLPDATGMGNLIKDASRDAQFSNLARAESLGRALILFGEQEKSETLVALGEIALGDAFRLQNKQLAGLNLLDRAAERFERCGDEVGWARTRIGWLGSVVFLESYPPVEPIVQRALQIFESRGESRYLLPLFQNYAHYCIAVGRLGDALPICEQALSIAQAISDEAMRSASLLSVLVVLIQAHCEVGNYGDAESYVQMGLALQQKRAAQDALAVEFLRAISSLYLRTGQYTQSLYTLEQARKSTLRGDMLLTLEYRSALAYLHLNRFAESEARLSSTLATLEPTAENSFRRAMFLYLLAEVYRLTQRREEALESAAEALSLLLKRSNPSLAWQNVMYRQHAFLYHQTGQHALAQSAIATAVSLADVVGEHVEQINTRLLASQILTDKQSAWQALTEADQMAQSLPWLRWRVNQEIARLTDDPAVRRRALIQATDDLDSVQSSLAASFHADYLIEAQNLYAALIQEYLEGGEIECAWQTVERAKSRALLNTMMAQQETATALDSPLLAELKELQLRHYELTRQVANGRASYAEAQPTLKSLEGEIARTQERIEIDQWGRREPLGVPPPFIPAAPPDSDLVGYYVVENGVHLFIHNGVEYRHEYVEIPLPDLHAFLEAIYTNGASAATAPDPFVLLLHRQLLGILGTLFTYLIAPVQSWLRHERLVIVPHGVLHQLPFHLLWNGSDYLFSACEIRVVPTARLLQRESGVRNAPLHHAVISHDWDGKLLNARHEAAAVARLLGTSCHYDGGAATKEAALTLLESRGLLHIAAHGAHRPDNPELSHIQLADGQLTLVDLFTHSVHKDLVTLSACETGMTVVRAGDDPVGLWRGFLAAGARSLLVALWQLEDKIAEQLMTWYYSRLAGGMTRVCALREVQQTWLASADGRYRHPFYWGAYQLIGDDGPIPLHPDTEYA